jgi:hypothetical protein
MTTRPVEKLLTREQFRAAIRPMPPGLEYGALADHDEAQRGRIAELERQVDVGKMLVQESLDRENEARAQLAKAEEALRDIADHGCRHDTNPTNAHTWDVVEVYEYMRSMDASVTRRAQTYFAAKAQQAEGGAMAGDAASGSSGSARQDAVSKTTCAEVASPVSGGGPHGVAAPPSLPATAKCERCGWSTATSEADGCVPGNCSMRPAPPATAPRREWWVILDAANGMPVDVSPTIEHAREITDPSGLFESIVKVVPAEEAERDKWSTLVTSGEANGCYPCDTCNGFRAKGQPCAFCMGLHARLNGQLADARAEAERLRDVLALVEVDVALERSWCRICRTEGRGDFRGRQVHPHEPGCVLSRPDSGTGGEKLSQDGLGENVCRECGGDGTYERDAGYAPGEHCTTTETCGDCAGTGRKREG